MRIEEIEEMRGLPILADVQPGNADKLLRSALLQRFPAYVELIREGDPADFLHVVVEGQVEVFSRYRDRETTVSVLSSGCFILAAVLLDRPYLKSVRALTPSRILLMPAELVRQVFETDAGFARTLAFELASAYRGIVKELKNQKLRSNLERLANWLLLNEALSGGSGTFNLPFDKKVLAARLGMAPEVLSRCFRSLDAYQVKVNGRTVTIKDRDALHKLAGPSPLIDDPTV